ncbi:hypothetical protein ACIGC1_14585 [Peribacillus butanolivorans]
MEPFSLIHTGKTLVLHHLKSIHYLVVIIYARPNSLKISANQLGT